MTTSAQLEVTALSKGFGSGATRHEVIGDLTLSVSEGEFVCIVGPSGAGKTTLLRCLSGLMRPSAGEVRFSGELVEHPVAEIAVVFQDYRGTLLPWASVIDNVAFPLRAAGVAKKERRERAAAALEQVGLSASAEKSPWQLSGGMQQRVAIARALAYGAPVLLMDEPFGSVDAQTRFELEDLILSLRTKLGLTVIVVTHDIDEAVYLSDRVIVVAGKPTSVIDEITIGLGAERDQYTTRSSALFAELRSRVLSEVTTQRVAAQA